MKRLTMATLVATAVFILAGGTVIAHNGNTMTGEQPGNETKSSMSERTTAQGGAGHQMRGHRKSGPMMCGMTGRSDKRQHMGYVQKMRRACHEMWQKMWGNHDHNEHRHSR